MTKEGQPAWHFVIGHWWGIRHPPRPTNDEGKTAGFALRHWTLVGHSSFREPPTRRVKRVKPRRLPHRGEAKTAAYRPTPAGRFFPAQRPKRCHTGYPRQGHPARREILCEETGNGKCCVRENPVRRWAGENLPVSFAIPFQASERRSVRQVNCDPVGTGVPLVFSPAKTGGTPVPLDRLIPAQRLRPPVETSKWSETRECEAPASSRRSPNRSHGPPT